MERAAHRWVSIALDVQKTRRRTWHRSVLFKVKEPLVNGHSLNEDDQGKDGEGDGEAADGDRRHVGEVESL